jgi:molybdate transport system substrate-binding protein
MPSQLRILSSMAPREVLAAAVALYGEQAPTGIELASAGGLEVARRVNAGEAVDIVVLASNAIETLVCAGYVLADTRTNLMSSEIAIAVRTGTPHPAVANEASVRDLVLAAASLSYSTGPSGSYLEKLFERWELLDAIRAKSVIPPPGRPVAQLIASGEVDLGFQQLSELLHVPGVDVIACLPPTIAHTTMFTAGITSACRDREQATQFLEFAASSATEPIMRRCGLKAVR